MYVAQGQEESRSMEKYFMLVQVLPAGSDAYERVLKRVVEKESEDGIGENQKSF